MFALVDYDNAKVIRSERTQTDVNDNVDLLAESLSLFSSRIGIASEIRIRLYGGWTDYTGRYTPQGERVFQAVEIMRGTRNRVRLIPEVVTSLACTPGYELRGLYRVRPGGKTEQKMVDTALCCDAIYLSRYRETLIYSDDDDLMIGALAVAAESKPIYLLRSRASGKALNDHICAATGVKIHQVQ